MTTLLIATRNAHKVGEIRAILGPQFQFLTLNDFPDAPKVTEDADTFAGNAVKKSVELAKWLNIQYPTSNAGLCSRRRFRAGSGCARWRPRRSFRTFRGPRSERGRLVRECHGKF